MGEVRVIQREPAVSQIIADSSGNWRGTLVLLLDVAGKQLCWKVAPALEPIKNAAQK